MGLHSIVCEFPFTLYTTLKAGFTLASKPGADQGTRDMLTEEQREQFSDATGIWNAAGKNMVSPDDIMSTPEPLEDFISQWGEPELVPTTHGMLYTWPIGEKGRLFFMDFGSIRAAVVKLR